MIVPGASFPGALILYTILLTLYYFLRRKSFSKEQTRTSKITESIILGCLGLFVIEWIFIGNSPSGNPDAFQSSMFIWWIWVFYFPKVMIGEKYSSLRKNVLYYHILFSLAFWGFMILMKQPLAFVLIYAYGLWIFYYYLFRYIYSSH
ncbi:MAG: hypothetical protein HHAS10_07830 [Candidatus Altimarinota bacterium]